MGFFVCVCRFTNAVQSNVVYTLSLPAFYCYWFISKRWSYVLIFGERRGGVIR